MSFLGFFTLNNFALQNFLLKNGADLLDIYFYIRRKTAKFAAYHGQNRVA